MGPGSPFIESVDLQAGEAFRVYANALGPVDMVAYMAIDSTGMDALAAQFGDEAVDLIRSETDAEELDERFAAPGGREPADSIADGGILLAADADSWDDVLTAEVAVDDAANVQNDDGSGSYYEIRFGFVAPVSSQYQVLVFTDEEVDVEVSSATKLDDDAAAKAKESTTADVAVSGIELEAEWPEYADFLVDYVP